MNDLSEFLLARIADDELVATNQAILWSGDPHYEHDEATDYELWFTPARIHAECGAKRQIVQRFVNAYEADDMLFDAEEYDGVLRLLALPYADHPDYREEWRA